MRRRLAILADQFGWHVQDLLRAACALRIEAEVVGFRRLCWEGSGTGRQRVLGTALEAGSERAPVVLLEETGAKAVDAVVVRCLPAGSLEQIVFRLDVLHVLDTHGVLVLNPPRALELAVDKTLSLALLQRAGLPVPRTAVAENRFDALEAFRSLGGDVVVKPLFGSEGRGIHRIREQEEARRVLTVLEELRCVLYVQEYIDDVEADVRVLVLAGEVLAAVRRRHANDWRHNAARGAVTTAHKLDAHAARLAIAAAGELGAVFAGVDLLYSSSRGVLVVEVNAVPGWRATRRATGVDVAAKLLDYVVRRVGR